MLQHLAIKNYILIQDISVDLSDNFNVFTGETGSGKSMLVDALNFAFGQRSSASIVGKYDDVSRVEVIFTVADNHPVIPYLEEIGFDVDPSDPIIISRDMNRDGKSNARINHRIVTASLLRELAGYLIDIHSQHETQSLLNSKQHLNLLDRFASIQEALETYTHLYQTYKDAQRDLETFESSDISPDEIERAEAMLRELEKFKPSVDDYTSLTENLETMSNFERYQTIYSDMLEIFKQNDALARLYDGLSLYEELNNDTLGEKYREAYFLLEDVRDTVQALSHELQFDAYEFDTYQSRMYQYQQYFRKFGDVEGILAVMETYDALLHRAKHFDEIREDFQNIRDVALDAATESAKSLSVKRRDAAVELEKAVEVQLHDLMLEHARFEVKFSSVNLNQNGHDNVQFYVSMNKGEDLAPLDKVASGGELSRLMLGLKVIFSRVQHIDTIVFDEIDTGVSGRVGMRIGQKMKDLSKEAQVLTITHLSSVAAHAHQHYKISKSQEDEATMTSIDQLTPEEQVEQLALIMSGSVSNASLLAAQELLKEGQSF